MSGKPTIRDVAEICGCSVFTVSSVLNNKGRISEAMRAKVRQAVRQLNYDPLRNMPLARRLTAEALALVLPSLRAEDDPFFWRAVTTARRLAAARNQDLKLFSEQDLNARLDESNSGHLSLGFDRLLVFCCDPPRAALKELLRRGIPLALVRRDADLRGIISVRDNDERGIELAMEHLHRTHGHTRIGLLAGRFHAGVPQVRRSAYQRYVRANGLDDDPLLCIESDSAGEPWPRRLLELVRQKKLTALVVMSDSQAVLACSAMLKAKVRIPEDLAVVSYSNTATAAMFHPGLTAVHVPVTEMVTAACQALFVHDIAAAPARTVLEFENSLVVRESCGCCGVDVESPTGSGDLNA